MIGKFNNLSIDEEFEESDDFILASTEDAIEEEFDDCSNEEEITEFETSDNRLDKDQVRFELSEDVQDFWSCDDVITKLVKEQRNKDSKALVLWQPRILLPLSDETKREKKSEIVDQTDEYTVYSEADELKENDAKDDKLEIIELEEFDTVKLSDEDMMEI